MIARHENSKSYECLYNYVKDGSKLLESNSILNLCVTRSELSTKTQKYFNDHNVLSQTKLRNRFSIFHPTKGVGLAAKC